MDVYFTKITDSKTEEALNEGIRKYVPQLLAHKSKSINLQYYEVTSSLFSTKKEVWEKWKFTLNFVKVTNMEQFVKELEETLRIWIFNVVEKLNLENKFAP